MLDCPARDIQGTHHASPTVAKGAAAQQGNTVLRINVDLPLYDGSEGPNIDSVK